MGNITSSSSSKGAKPQHKVSASASAPPSPSSSRSPSPTPSRSVSRSSSRSPSPSRLSRQSPSKQQQQHVAHSRGKDKASKKSKPSVAIRQIRQVKAKRLNGGKNVVSGSKITIRRDIVAAPTDAGILMFRDEQGMKELCWDLGYESGKQFSEKLRDSSAVLFNPQKGAKKRSERVRILFQVFGGYAERTVHITKPVTLHKVIMEVDKTALQTIAKLSSEAGFKKGVTEAMADRELHGTSICSFYIRLVGGARDVYVTWRTAEAHVNVDSSILYVNGDPKKSIDPGHSRLSRPSHIHHRNAPTTPLAGSHFDEPSKH